MLVEYHGHNHLPCLDPWSSKWDGIVWLHSLERHTATSTQSFSKQWKAHFEALGQRPNSWGQGQGGESGQSFSISCHLCLTPHTNCGDDCMIVQVMTILGVHTSQQKLAPAVFQMVSRLVAQPRNESNWEDIHLLPILILHVHTKPRDHSSLYGNVWINQTGPKHPQPRSLADR